MARPRQRELLPPDSRRRTPPYQRHRLRQYREPAASARAADGDGFAALLVDEVQYRRLPFRSRRDARPRAAWFRSRLRFLRRVAPGSDPVATQADFRAMGHRPWRLSTRQPSTGLCRMERSFPRYSAPLLAR